MKDISVNDIGPFCQKQAGQGVQPYLLASYLTTQLTFDAACKLSPTHIPMIYVSGVKPVS